MVVVLMETTNEDKSCEASKLLPIARTAVNIKDVPFRGGGKAREEKAVEENKTIRTRREVINTLQLKELLVLQLDLIEHQQLEMLYKEKQIISLKSEKEQLEARLCRMERRLALQKRHSLETDENIQKSKLSAASKNICVNQPVVTGKKDVQLDGKLSQSLPVTVTSRSDRDFRFNTYLRTDKAFLDLPDTKLLPLVTGISISEFTSKTDAVSVPQWKVLQNMYCSLQEQHEEDITNDAYSKRHFKPEQEEKRRKRWDLQHLRQQHHHDMLVQKYNDREKKAKNISNYDGTLSVESLYRNPDNVMAVEVGSNVPVCAFGYPVPAVMTRELELPWFSIARREIQIRNTQQRRLKKKIKTSVGRSKSTRPVH